MLEEETTTPDAIGPTRGAYSKLSPTVNAETKTHQSPIQVFFFFLRDLLPNPARKEEDS